MVETYLQGHTTSRGVEQEGQVVPQPDDSGGRRASVGHDALQNERGPSLKDPGGAPDDVGPELGV